MIAVLAFLERYGNADDREYCRRYIRKLRLKPKAAMRSDWSCGRGRFSRIIEEVLAETEIDEASDALRWLEKKAADNSLTKKKKQLFDFLLRKGYSYDIIKEAFRQME